VRHDFPQGTSDNHNAVKKEGNLRAITHQNGIMILPLSKKKKKKSVPGNDSGGMRTMPR
jgi:hypothetical protein